VNAKKEISHLNNQILSDHKLLHVIEEQNLITTSRLTKFLETPSQKYTKATLQKLQNYLTESTLRDKMQVKVREDLLSLEIKKEKFKVPTQASLSVKRPATDKIQLNPLTIKRPATINVPTNKKETATATGIRHLMKIFEKPNTPQLPPSPAPLAPTRKGSNGTVMPRVKSFNKTEEKVQPQDVRSKTPSPSFRPQGRIRKTVSEHALLAPSMSSSSNNCSSSSSSNNNNIIIKKEQQQTKKIDKGGTAIITTEDDTAATPKDDEGEHSSSSNNSNTRYEQQHHEQNGQNKRDSSDSSNLSANERKNTLADPSMKATASAAEHSLQMLHKRTQEKLSSTNSIIEKLEEQQRERNQRRSSRGIRRKSMENIHIELLTEEQRELQAKQVFNTLTEIANENKAKIELENARAKALGDNTDWWGDIKAGLEKQE